MNGDISSQHFRIGHNLIQQFLGKRFDKIYGLAFHYAQKFSSYLPVIHSLSQVVVFGSLNFQFRVDYEFLPFPAFVFIYPVITGGF